MNTHIYFIRHGETDWNKEGRFQGHSDIPLNEAGTQQAEQLADYLQNHPLAAIYTSDLSRARQTGEIIAKHHGLSAQSYPEFRERHGGEWEGKYYTEIEAVYPNWRHARMTGGVYGLESTADVQKRMLTRLLLLLEQHQGEQIVIVAHGACLRALFTLLAEDENWDTTRLGNTSITHFTFHQDHGWQLHALNQTPHL